MHLRHSEKPYVKNPPSLKSIPQEELFISESGYAYSLSEIVNFIEGGEVFKRNMGSSFEMPGTLRDFKNKEIEPDHIRDEFRNQVEITSRRRDIPLSMFTENDLRVLLKFPPIAKAFQNTASFNDLQGIAHFLHETGTLSLICEMTKKSQILVNLIESTIDTHLALIISEPLHKLADHVNRLPSPYKKILSDLTSGSGLFGSYAAHRSQNDFVKDLRSMTSPRGACGINFAELITNLHNFFVSHHLYRMIMSTLKDEIAQHDVPEVEKEKGEEKEKTESIEMREEKQNDHLARKKPDARTSFAGKMWAKLYGSKKKHGQTDITPGKLPSKRLK